MRCVVDEVCGSVTQLVAAAPGGRLHWLMQYPASSPKSSSRGIFHSLLDPRPGELNHLEIYFLQCYCDFFVFVCLLS